MKRSYLLITTLAASLCMSGCTTHEATNTNTSNATASAMNLDQGCPHTDAEHMTANTARGCAVRHHGVEVLSYGDYTERTIQAADMLKKLSSTGQAGDLVLVIRENGRTSDRVIKEVWHTNNLTAANVHAKANPYIKMGNLVRVEFFKNAADVEPFKKEILIQK